MIRHIVMVVCFFRIVLFVLIMINFIIKESNHSVNVYKVESDLFGQNLILMGYFADYNKHKAEAFLSFLLKNPNSDITQFFKQYNK